MSSLDSDYDGAWKELLELHLDAILGCLFPHVGEAVDWTCPLEYLDQELHNLLSLERSQVRRVDKLVRVTALDGRKQCLLLHVEVQSFQEADFARRIYRYHHSIQLAHPDEDVISMAVLADLNPAWQPTEYRVERLGCLNHFRFITCKLLEILPRLEEDFSIPALAVKAQIAALRSSTDPEARYLARWKLVRSLYEHGYKEDEVRKAYRFLSWMMRMPAPLTLKFQKQVLEFEKERNMPYVADTEVLAREQGIHEGLIQGKLEGILFYIEHALGNLGEDLRRQILSLPLEVKEQFNEAAPGFRHLSEVHAWLQSHAA